MAYRPDSGRQLKSAVKSHTSLIFVLDDTAYCKMYSWKNILLNMPKSHRIKIYTIFIACAHPYKIHPTKGTSY